MSQLLSLFESIKTFILDVDGVLTNGQLLVQNDGSLLRNMNIKDGYALQLAIKKNYKIIIISGGNNEGVIKRLEGLKVIECYFGIHDKKSKLLELQQLHNLNLNTCLYMGDDMPDVAPMQMVGLAACPSDACIQALASANYVSPFNGGEGCVRDVIEKVMTLKGLWE